MSETKAIRKYKKHAKPLNYQLVRVLREVNFSPLRELLTQVYPELEPKDKMQCILSIMSYLHAKPKAVETDKKKKGPAIQVNTQVNLPSQEDINKTTPTDVLKLLEAAEDGQDK